MDHHQTESSALTQPVRTTTVTVSRYMWRRQRNGRGHPRWQQRKPWLDGVFREHWRGRKGRLDLSSSRILLQSLLLAILVPTASSQLPTFGVKPFFGQDPASLPGTNCLAITQDPNCPEWNAHYVDVPLVTNRIGNFSDESSFTSAFQDFLSLTVQPQLKALGNCRDAVRTRFLASYYCHTLFAASQIRCAQTEQVFRPLCKETCTTFVDSVKREWLDVQRCPDRDRVEGVLASLSENKNGKTDDGLFWTDCWDLKSDSQQCVKGDDNEPLTCGYTSERDICLKCDRAVNATCPDEEENGSQERKDSSSLSVTENQGFSTLATVLVVVGLAALLVLGSVGTVCIRRRRLMQRAPQIPVNVAGRAPTPFRLSNQPGEPPRETQAHGVPLPPTTTGPGEVTDSGKKASGSNITFLQDATRAPVAVDSAVSPASAAVSKPPHMQAPGAAAATTGQPTLSQIHALATDPSVQAPSHPFRVVYGYAPEASDEMTIQIGDIITVWRLFDDGWAYGVNHRSGEVGVLPQMAIREIPVSKEAGGGSGLSSSLGPGNSHGTAVSQLGANVIQLPSDMPVYAPSSTGNTAVLGNRDALIQPRTRSRASRTVPYKESPVPVPAGSLERCLGQDMSRLS